MNPLQKMKLASLVKKVEKFHELREAGNAGERAEEVKAHLELGRFYDEHKADKEITYPLFRALECYRAAARLGDPDALYFTGERFLEIGKFWDEINSSVYATDVQQSYANTAYKEAFHYLEAAEEMGHALATRLHGMAYVNGWGVPADPPKGFGLVIDSIDLADAWAQATKIFESLGLNTPAFYSALGARQKGS